jgi:transposase
VSRRRQLLGMIAAENNRLSLAPKAVAKRIEAHIRWLEKELSRTERDLEAAIESSPALSENEALLRSVPGVGPVLASTLVSGVPEPGTLTHKRVAALVGVAPLNRDSGTLRGHRSVWGEPTSELCAVHGRPGGSTPQPGSEGVLRASFVFWRAANPRR